MRALLVLLALCEAVSASGCSRSDAAGFPWNRRPGAAGGGGAGLSILQAAVWESAYPYNLGSPTTTRTIAPASPLTAGSAFAVLARHEMVISAWADGINTYDHPVANTGGGQSLDAYVASNVAGGTPTISVTVDNPYLPFGGCYFEIGGANTTTATEANANDAGDSTSTDWYGGAVTAAGAALAIGWWITNNGDLDYLGGYGIAADAGWTLINYVNKWVDDGCVYKVVSAGAVGTHGPHATTVANGYGPHLGSAILIH